MSEFLRVTDRPTSERRIKIAVPGVIPAGAEYNIFITAEARESGEITVSRDGKPRVVIRKNGVIAVDGKEI